MLIKSVICTINYFTFFINRKTHLLSPSGSLTGFYLDVCIRDFINLKYGPWYDLSSLNFGCLLIIIVSLTQIVTWWIDLSPCFFQEDLVYWTIFLAILHLYELQFFKENCATFRVVIGVFGQNIKIQCCGQLGIPTI